MRVSKTAGRFSTPNAIGGRIQLSPSRLAGEMAIHRRLAWGAFRLQPLDERGQADAFARRKFFLSELTFVAVHRQLIDIHG